MAAAALGIATVSATTSALAILQDRFDEYADKAVFVAGWLMVGAAARGSLDGTNWASPTREVYYGLSAQRNESSFTESGIPSLLNEITFSFSFYNSDAAATPSRQFANLQDGTALGGVAASSSRWG